MFVYINLYFKKEWTLEKISYELCAYESVDDRSLSYRLFLKNQRTSEFVQQRSNIVNFKRYQKIIIKLTSKWCMIYLLNLI